MAEPTEEKELNLDEDSEAAVDSSSGKSKKLIIAVVALLVLGAGGAGAYFFLFSDSTDPEIAEEEIEEPIEEAHYLALEPVFIINLPDKGKQRFLQAAVTLMARSTSVLIKVEQNMPVIRHHLTNIMSAHTVDSIQSNGGIEAVRSQALDQINKVLIEEYGGEAIEQVLFTSFVMQ